MTENEKFIVTIEDVIKEFTRIYEENDSLKKENILLKMHSKALGMVRTHFQHHEILTEEEFKDIDDYCYKKYMNERLRCLKNDIMLINI